MQKRRSKWNTNITKQSAMQGSQKGTEKPMRGGDLQEASRLATAIVSIRMDNKDGGEGSGNWGHEGREGEVGGSKKGGGAQNRSGSKESGYTSEAKEKKKGSQSASKSNSSSESQASSSNSYTGGHMLWGLDVYADIDSDNRTPEEKEEIKREIDEVIKRASVRNEETKAETSKRATQYLTESLASGMEQDDQESSDFSYALQDCAAYDMEPGDSVTYTSKGKDFSLEKTFIMEEKNYEGTYDWDRPGVKIKAVSTYSFLGKSYTTEKTLTNISQLGDALNGTDDYGTKPKRKVTFKRNS